MTDGTAELVAFLAAHSGLHDAVIASVQAEDGLVTLLLTDVWSTDDDPFMGRGPSTREASLSFSDASLDLRGIARPRDLNGYEIAYAGCVEGSFWFATSIGAGTIAYKAVGVAVTMA